MNKLFIMVLSLVLLNNTFTIKMGAVKPFNNSILTAVVLDSPVQTQDVIFTNFTDKQLGSRLKRSELVLNDEGIYTYNGKVCVATATYECLASTYGACSKYDFAKLPDGYHHYRYFDEFKIVYKGVEYEAIVVDSCGACSVSYNGETLQRVDVLVADGYKHTKTQGLLIIE